MDDSDDGSITLSSKASSGKSEQIRSLHDRLLRESLTRQEIDEVYERLRSEYDLLLTKHAQAENTIDQLRIGARVDLFSDGPIPHQARQLQVVEIKSTPEPISVSSPERAVLNWPRHTVDAGTGIGNGDTDSPESQEKFNSNFIHRLKDLQNDVVAFQSALADRELSYEDQKNLYNALKDKHGQLKEQLTKMSQQGDGNSQGTNTANGRPSNHFLDPNSLEGELYRLELRLAEVCDDIGDQLFSNRENDGALEQALRDDFKRMRLASQASEGARQRTLSGRNNLSVKDDIRKDVTKKPSRSSSDLSGQARDEHSSVGGSPSRGDEGKKEVLSPSNEDLAESGYYASESMIRELPKREGANMPLRYLTRSRSPGEKNHAEISIRRHWSLSEMNSEEESIDEITLHSSDAYDNGGKVRPAHQPRSEKTYDEGTDKDASRSKAGSVGQSSRQRSMVEDLGTATGPAATSSPLEEKRREEVTPHDRISVKGSADEADVHRARPRKSRNELKIRTSPSDRSILENKTDGRRSSVKSGSRLSKTRPRPYNHSSSEESYPTNRPDRVNSSVYSEQDKVPSLVNHPKGNVYGTRHRPNTAESNLDSGFVGSEGTLKSQDMSNGGKQRLPRQSRRQSTTRDNGPKQQPMPSSLTSDQSFISNEPRSHATQPAASSVQGRPSRSRRDSSLGRLSEGTQESRMHIGSSSESRRPGEPRGVEATDKSQFSTTARRLSNRLREKSRKKTPLDDVISLQTSPETQTDVSFKRLPVTAERSPFPSDIRMQDLDYADSPIRVAKETRRGKFDYPRNEDADVGSGNQRSSYYGEGSSAADQSERPRTIRRERVDRSFNGSSYSSADRRPSQQTDHLRNDLQLLREQLARLDRISLKPAINKHSSVREEPQQPSEIPRDRAYDDIRQKLDDINRQLQRPFQLPAETDYRQAKRRTSFTPNREYEELKKKIDYLTQEVQRSREINPLHEADYAANSPSHRQQTHSTPNRELYQTTNQESDPRTFQESHRKSFQDLHTGTFKEPTQRTFRDSQPGTFLESHPTDARESHPTLIPVCPICTGVGYHKHGNYVFPRDFLESGRPLRVVPDNLARDSNVSTVHITSTPVGVPARLATPLAAHTILPDAASQVPMGHIVNTSSPYRSMSNLAAVGGSPMYPLPNTVHHIHTFHGKRRPKISSSSSEDEPESEGERRKSRRRSKPRKSRSTSRLLDEYDDWRLNESLNEATRAAGDMQRVSRRMLNNLATDLINSGYSEY